MNISSCSPTKLYKLKIALSNMKEKNNIFNYIVQSNLILSISLRFQLKRYFQGRKSRQIKVVHIEGTKVPLYGAASNLVVSNNAVQVPLTLEFEIRTRGDVVGKLVRTKRRRRISCPLIIDSTSNKPIKFKKDSCTYS